MAHGLPHGNEFDNLNFGSYFGETGAMPYTGAVQGTGLTKDFSAGAGAFGNAGFGVNAPSYNPMDFNFLTGGGDTGGGRTPRTAEQWQSMGSGLSTMASGFADVIGAKDRMAKQQGLADAAKLDIDQFRTDATAGKYDAKTNKQMLDSFSFGRQDLDINPSLSMAATAMDNMSTDPRMMAAGLGGMNTSNTKSLQGLQQQNRQNELANAQGYGQYMGGLQTQNEGFQRGLATDKFQDDKLAFSTATDNKMKMDEARRQGWGNIVGGGVQAATSFFGEKGMKIPEFQEGGDVMQQLLAAQGEGGIPPRQDLPGEESHEANPISMVAPDGEVVGEATGGEIILNGEQTEDIENAVAMVDQAVESGQEPSKEALMALYEAVSKTLSQPQFQDGEQQESSSPEQERMMAMLDGGQQMA
tara:strand:+ start:2632 stop:3873 length:1242 start_codon:yes stop_codon:yes gene_type:complete